MATTHHAHLDDTWKLPIPAHRAQPARPATTRSDLPRRVHREPRDSMARRLTDTDLDPVDGFVAALQRHLSQGLGDDDKGTAACEGVPEPEDTAAASQDRPEDTPVSWSANIAGAEAALPAPDDLEHGDRDTFLAESRRRLAGDLVPNPVHPPPDEGPEPEAVPEPSYANLDVEDLVGTFAEAVEEAGGIFHRVTDEVPDTLLDRLVAELDAWEVVVSAEPVAQALGERLAGRGVEVAPATPSTAARAAMGLTSAVAGIAATGSVVLDSRAGGRLASLLPPIHLCVLRVEDLVATPADVLRHVGDDPGGPPPTLVVVTGPSRTGDIEQILTLGAHGPTALHVVVVG